jgi:hypothetical protein
MLIDAAGSHIGVRYRRSDRRAIFAFAKNPSGRLPVVTHARIDH